MPSGVYAIWLTAGDDEDYLPFVIRPPKGAARAKIAVVMSTLTYAIYANFTDIGKGGKMHHGVGPMDLQHFS